MKLSTKIHVPRLLVLIFLLTQSISAAQSVEDTWERPINLSQSGAATKPTIVLDKDGKEHVLWLDDLDGVIHSEMTEEGWNEPQSLAALFSTGVPKLVADESGTLHAFWRDEENVLQYSRLSEGDFNDVEAWTTPVELGVSVLTIEVALGGDNRLHVAYIKSIAQEADDAEASAVEEDPAGVYYRVSDDGGENWSEAASVYNSLYYRQLEEADAHVQVTTTRDSILIVWDDTPNERILGVRSSDAGQSWNDVRQIDGRTTLDEVDAVSPSQVKVETKGGLIYVQWQAAHGDNGCAFYYQWSRTAGVTWEPIQRISEDFPVCGESSETFFHNDILYLLIHSSNGAYYLLAWDNGRWSEAEEQKDFVNFLDPETFRSLSLDCLDGVIENDRFYLVGCDELGGGDVWITSRFIDDDSAFFPPPSIWSVPASIITNNATAITPVSISDPVTGIHVMWSQAESFDDLNSSATESSIYYARLDGRSFLGPRAIVSSPQGSAENPAVALDNSGRLLLVWSGSAGDIYFSRAEADRAQAPSTWADPIRLPVPRSAASGPSILVDRTGTIHVAYTISLNEERGLYLTDSRDGGATWSDPTTAFDGITNDWNLVSPPHLSQTGNGNLYLLWSQYSLPPDQRAQGLYFSRLVNGGEIWSEPELVAEGSVIWSQILGLSEQVVHRVWQEIGQGRSAIWHEFSIDSGLNWSDPALIFPPYNEPIKSVALISDSFNQLYLLQMTNDTLRHWLWDGEHWIAQAQLALNGSEYPTLESLTATADLERGLVAIFASQFSETADGNDGEVENKLFFYTRPLEMPKTRPEPLPTLTPTPQSTPTVTPTPGPSPTPTIVFSNEANEETRTGGLLPSIFTRDPLLSGLILAGMIVAIIFLVGLLFRALRGGGR